jgi:hypothetical protein
MFPDLLLAVYARQPPPAQARDTEPQGVPLILLSLVYTLLSQMVPELGTFRDTIAGTVPIRSSGSSDCGRYR